MSAISDKEMWEIGQRIADKRNALGFSQEEFAEQIGLSRAAVGKIERGEVAPRTDTLISVCRILGTTPNAILMGTGQRQVDLDPELLAIAEMMKAFSPEQKRQFYTTMNLVSAGIQNPASGFLKIGN